MIREQKIASFLSLFKELGIEQEIDYDKFYSYPLNVQAPIANELIGDYREIPANDESSISY